jgi:hypothetical protein
MRPRGSNPSSGSKDVRVAQWRGRAGSWVVLDEFKAPGHHRVSIEPVRFKPSVATARSRSLPGQASKGGAGYRAA